MKEKPLPRNHCPPKLIVFAFLQSLQVCFGNDYAKSQNTHLKKVKSAELATSWRLLETIWEKHVSRVTFNFCYL